MSGKIFILYPRGARTGGPEALHQLGWALRQLGLQSYMAPLTASVTNARVEEYEKYGVPEAQVEDHDDNTVIVGETRISQLRHFQHARKIAWWLSVDNSPYFYNASRSGADAGNARWVRAKYQLLHHARRLAGRGVALEKIEHLAQSHYARSFIYSRIGVLPALITDFSEIESGMDPVASPRTPRNGGRLSIAYNPKKGGAVLDAIMRSTAGRYDWRPIENMSRAEVVNLLSSTDIYLDLGHHPGRDRLPREAAVLGCVVIVGMRGSAAFAADVPLHRSFKVDMAHEPVQEALTVLAAAELRLDEFLKAQAGYRNWVLGEKENFLLEVELFFKEGRRSSEVLDSRLWQ